ncbi:MAG: DUF1638 domain-containing protein [Spirochaetaceae bacterium]|jgi:hypothetical protein|nr:DUF1638 domain-containing protein [Spirochaetaceae bacterium]
MAKYALVACEVARKEFDLLVPGSKHEVDIIYIDMGLHVQGGEKMIVKLQETLDAIDQTGYDAILLGYGLCNNGICSLHANIPIVVPRAHDCITLFMGSRQSYRDYFDTHKGTYFVTTGAWGTDLTFELMDGAFSKDVLRAEYMEKYDEEEAEYLLEMLGDPLKQYRRLTFVNNGLGDAETVRTKAREVAEHKNWEFDEFPGNTDILSGLVSGDWDPAVFLVVRPGEQIAQAFTDEEIVRAVSPVLA